jgi:hypothetical protein
VPQTGQVNRVAADFQPNQDLYTLRAPKQAINTARLSKFTIEGAFRLDALSTETVERYQTIVGKDGRPSEKSPNAPLQIVVAGRTDPYTTRNALSAQVIDADGEIRFASSTQPLAKGVWYWFAAVCDGSTLSLYVDRGDGKGYQLEARNTQLRGGMIESADSWTIGRGEYHDAPHNWFNGQIDEIRISAEALPIDRLLNSKSP